MIRKQQNAIVKKSNALIRSYWAIDSIWEPRLVALLASKVHVKDEDFKIYRISVSEVIGVNYGGHDLKDLVTVIDSMMGRIITISEGPTKIHKYNIFSRCTIDTQNGILELCFHPDLKPHFLQLKEHFTQYSLAEFISLPSIYSQRIYEILKSYDDMPEVCIALNELCDLLDVPASLRADFR